MKKTLLLLCVFFAINLIAQDQIISVFDEILFYDGYASLEQLEDEMVPVPEGIIRHSTAVYGTKLTNEQLSLIGDEITLEVIVKAACDNYDRLGHVHLALVPKGAETYETTDPDVHRIEIARFITPFMNKNRQPNTVPYLFDVSNLTHIFKDEVFREEYDFWMELDIFGVPYAANTQVSGCAGRSDVFYGSLNFITSTPSAQESENNFLFKFFDKNRFNNYQHNATDEIGKTVKTAHIILTEKVTNAHLYLITSNHGAYANSFGSVGEEYNRRLHYVYFDGEEVLQYKPGRTSCEPFRVYNTQGNGIYGTTAKTDAQWQSFSNWCPGDIIDTRIISLGDLEAGGHSFKIEVPDALFIGEKGQGTDGNFPLSLYMQGKTEGESSLQVLSINDFPSKFQADIILYPNPAKDILNIETDVKPETIIIYNTMGQKVLEKTFTNSIDISQLKSGIYWINCIDAYSNIYSQKFIKY